VIGRSFQTFAAVAAFFVGFTSSIYGVIVHSLLTGSDIPSLTSFSTNPGPRKYGSLLMAFGGAAMIAVSVGIYRLLANEDSAWALFALALGVACGVITIIHALFLFFLSSALTRLYYLGDPLMRAAALAVDAIPAPLDPNGFSRYVLTGVWLVVNGVLMTSSPYFPLALAYLAVASGLGLFILFLGNVVERPAVMGWVGVPGAVLVGPLFWAWVGYTLLAS